MDGVVTQTLLIAHRSKSAKGNGYSQFRKKSIIISQNIIRKGTIRQQRNTFRTYNKSLLVQICAYFSDKSYIEFHSLVFFHKTYKS